MATQEAQLRWWATRSPDEIAYVDLRRDRSLTFAEWDEGADRLAGTLLRLGVSPDDRVALHVEADHPLPWLVSYAAIHRAAAVAVPTNTRLSRRELDTILDHAEPRVVLTSSGLADRHEGRTATTLVVDHDWDALLADRPDGLPPERSDDDLADIMYTSGTTGLPKGIAVRHRHTHLIPNGEPPWTGESWIHASPMFTFAGLSFVYNPMKMGMRGLYLPRFDVDDWFDAVARWRPTCAFVVPSMAQLLAASPRFETADLSSLTLVSIGSAPLPPSLHLRLAERLPEASVSNSYSMTEAGTSFTFLPRDEIARRPGSVGIPVGTEIRIVDEVGRVVGPGVVGEVEIKVGASHREYYRNPDATAATWSGGWLRSGDLGELDADGYLYIRGRKRDMIIRGGHNVMATDVESVLYEHPAVIEAAVVAVAHPVLGEDVGAAVVTRPDATVDAEELIAFCRERLADYKVPRRLWFLDELPRNPTGKVLKHEIVVPELDVDDGSPSTSVRPAAGP